ncbi:DUF6463 family protein [Paenibacillus sp. GCM10023248]|uniref:DUF6463 family protein n=1 Tax=unclassified Paenibacillus TaxID=185978 RepID=UPI002379EE2D|nr:DUF6463 family protein [Paenibacillus sp. MAHUQ-63]MDD9266706.1 DUF6463 family protein [Paenibacillus sp. MAHUQ-63]
MGIQKHSGWMLEWTAYLHTAIGLILFWKPVSDIAAAGVWNAVGRDIDRSNAIWFLFFGVLLWNIARMLRWLTTRQSIPIPRFVGWQILIFSIIGAICMPVSGFWLVIPQAIYMLKR